MTNLRRGMMAAAGGEELTGGKLFMWGGQSSGELGLGNTTSYCSPVQVGSDEDWYSINFGTNCSFVMKTDRSIWVMGYNNHGQLGISSTVNKSSPVQMGSAVDWLYIESGSGPSVAATNQAYKLYSWGNGINGGLGNGTTTTISSPGQVGALTNWKRPSTGQNFQLAAKTDGTLWSWGKNSTGQLGIGTWGGGTTEADESSPVQIGALTTWIDPTGGGEHSGAMKSDGKAWGWGAGGRTGDGTGTRRISPVQVETVTDWKQTARGYWGFSGVTDAGKLYSSGGGNSGINGDGSTTNRSGIVQVGGLTDWVYVHRLYRNAIAVKTDGTIWTWGNGSGGALGNGAITNKSSPIQVGSATDWLFDIPNRICSGRGFAGAIRSA